jgi:protein tyrosine phosphatase
MIVAHCLAGVGRTGTLGAVIEGVRCRRKFQALSMFEIVKNMRWNREYCVEWFEQYCFAHRQAQLIS